jgi:hypothetical protein
MRQTNDGKRSDDTTMMMMGWDRTGQSRREMKEMLQFFLSLS